MLINAIFSIAGRNEVIGMKSIDAPPKINIFEFIFRLENNQWMTNFNQMPSVQLVRNFMRNTFHKIACQIFHIHIASILLPFMWRQRSQNNNKKLKADLIKIISHLIRSWSFSPCVLCSFDSFFYFLVYIEMHLNDGKFRFGW